MRPPSWIVMLGMALCAGGCEFETRVPAEMVNLSRSQPAGGEKTLRADIRYNIGSIEISADKTGSVYSLDLDYDKASYTPQVDYQAGAEGRLSVRLEKAGTLRIRNERQTNRMRLGLSRNLPVSLELNTGVGDTRLALTAVPLTNLELEAGVGTTRITAYEPNTAACERVRIKNGVGSLEAVGLGNLNFRDFEFEGGVGGATLEFTGNWKNDAEIRIHVGIGGVQVRMPRDVGVRVDSQKNPLSGRHLDGFVKREAGYYSENYDKARVRVSVRVATGIGGFRVSWI